MMRVLETDSEDDDSMVLDEADRIRSLLIHEYEKVLGVEYRDAILKRIDYIIYYSNKCITSVDVDLQSDDSNKELFCTKHTLIVFVHCNY